MNIHELERLNEIAPARKIGMNRVSMTGSVATRFGYMVPHESELERNHILLFDFNPSVCGILAQPLFLLYKDLNGVTRKYFPDLLIHFDWIGRRRSAPPSWLCEVKYRAELSDIEQKAILFPKFKAAHRYAKKRGWRFRILTESMVNPHFLSNVLFLRRYRHEPRDPDIEFILKRTLRVLGDATPEALLAAAFLSPARRMEAICSLWHLVLDRVVLFDMQHPLNMCSPIRLDS